MRLLITPEVFQQLALTFVSYRWRLLFWSMLGFVLFVLLMFQIKEATPTPLVWLAISILFASFQALVLSSFIFFFQNLASIKEKNQQWYKLYRTIEWCEAFLFSLLLPAPILLFTYAMIAI